jgi:LPS sulfotransferase NodH
MYPHSYNMETIATYFRHYQQLMHFWQECFGESIVTISYESLVNNPSQQFESIFKHCGVIWKSDYLSYYKSNTLVGAGSRAHLSFIY